MDKLNAKVNSGQEETRFNTQQVGLYGYDASIDGGKWRRLACDSEGKQKIEATLELDSSGLAKESKQDTMINASVRDINNTGSIGDGSSQATTISLGYDRSNGKGRAVLVDASGKVEVNASMNTGHGLATEAKQDDIINATNRAINNTGSIGDGSTNATSVSLGYDRTGGKGRAVLVNSAGELMVNLGSATTQNVNIIGNEEADGSGTARHIHTDASGNVQTNIVNTANVKFEDISSSLNSGTANDPPNSLAVGLRGRQTIGDASTETFLLSDSDGKLQVGSTQLPTTLGQKANANCLSTCRSTTAGAYDLSARTTIGTASTSTKLLCDSNGRLSVDINSGGGSSTKVWNNQEVASAGTSLTAGNTIALDLDLGTGVNSVPTGSQIFISVFNSSDGTATGIPRSLSMTAEFSVDDVNYFAVPFAISKSIVSINNMFQFSDISGGSFDAPRYLRLQLTNTETAGNDTLVQVVAYYYL